MPTTTLLFDEKILSAATPRDDVMTATTMLFDEILPAVSPYEIAIHLGLNVGTVKRWIEKREVPNSYQNDLSRILGRAAKPIGNEREKDQFYTKEKTAKECLRRFEETAAKLRVNTADYTYIEPSAGAGAFYRLLPSDRRIGMDIEPRGNNIDTGDYLEYTPSKGKYLVVGNPPFGLRGHLALRFINHSAAFADMVAFILPPLFNSDGKGVPAKRVKGYTLAHTSAIEAGSFVYPDNSPVDVEAIFQVWTRINKEQINIPKQKSCKDFIRVYSLSDGGTPSSTRNKAMLYKCDVYLPSTCFTGMRAYKAFEELPHRRGYGIVIHQNKTAIKKLLHLADWGKVAFKSTNGALNLRTGLINSVVINGGFYDKH